MGEYDDMFNRETGEECARRESLERLRAERDRLRAERDRLRVERDRYKAALETIARRDCWNASETARESLMFKP